MLLLHFWASDWLRANICISSHATSNRTYPTCSTSPGVLRLDWRNCTCTIKLFRPLASLDQVPPLSDYGIVCVWCMVQSRTTDLWLYDLDNPPPDSLDRSAWRISLLDLGLLPPTTSPCPAPCSASELAASARRRQLGSASRLLDRAITAASHCRARNTACHHYLIIYTV